MNNRRVVITGLGVVAPNGIGLKDFEASLRAGRSGIEHDDELEKLDFRCHVSAKPPIDEELRKSLCAKYKLVKLKTNGLLYGVHAGVEAWSDAGLDDLKEKTDEPLWNMGCIFGCGAMSIDSCDYAVPHIRGGDVRRISTRLLLEAMNSSAASYLTSLIPFGNKVSSNSTACSTGTEALIHGFDQIRLGRADVMLTGSCETDGAIIWGVFDSLRVLESGHNDNPKAASRPFSSKTRALIPGSGAGALVLESLEHAQKRGARIYAEVLAGTQNSGGQVNGGSKTAPNKMGMLRCVQNAMQEANISGKDIDLISGHLTGTMADPIEVEVWKEALQLEKEEFPVINSIKSHIGHCIGAAGSIESVACVLQMQNSFAHSNMNIEPVHENILNSIPRSSIVEACMEKEINCVIKANFGFGDINTCVVLKKWK